MSPFARNAIASLILVPLFAFIGWILSGVPLSDEDFRTGPPKKEFKNVSLGWDRRSGNLLILQLDFKPEYFTREDRLRAWLEEPLAFANEKGWLQKSTLVVYPPEIGNYLFLMGSRKEILNQATESSAWSRNLFFQRFLFKNVKGLHLSEDSISYSSAEESKERYQRIFSSLAKIYGVDILAGSIRLPSPSAKEGILSIQPGNWEERAYIFNSEGKLIEGSLLKNGSRIFGPESKGNVSNVWVANVGFGRIGISFTEDLKNPDFEEASKKTYVSRWIGLGSVEDEGKFKDWIKNSSFETSGQIQFSGKAWDYEFPGKSFAKTRYGTPEPSDAQKGTILINIYL